LTTKSIVIAGSFVLFLAGYLSVNSTVAAQNNACIILSSFGESSFNSRVSSQPITITYSSSCLQFGSGLSIWLTTLLPGIYIYPCITTDSLGMLNLIVYPNPTTGSFYIKAKNNIGLSHQAELLIYNLKGQRVHKQSVQLINLRRGLNVNLHFVPAGVYYLLIQGKSIKGVGQIIKINE